MPAHCQGKGTCKGVGLGKWAVGTRYFLLLPVAVAAGVHDHVISGCSHVTFDGHVTPGYYVTLDGSHATPD